MNVTRNLFAKGDPVTGEGMVLYDTKHAVYPLDDKSCWDTIAEAVNREWEKLIPDVDGRKVRRPRRKRPRAPTLP